MARFIPYQGGSVLFVGVQGAAGNAKTLAKIQDKLARLPDVVVAQVRQALSEGCDGLVEEMKAIAPASELEPHPGALKDAIKKETGRHTLSFDVTCNPVGVDGQLYGAHVEFGHVLKGGEGNHLAASAKHVPAEPFFFPAFRHKSKEIKRRVRVATSKAIKSLDQG